MSAEMNATAECALCGMTFNIRNHQQQSKFKSGKNVFCSVGCGIKHSNIRQHTKHKRGPCYECGSFFWGRKDQVFCSKKCYTSSHFIMRTSHGRLSIQKSQRKTELHCIHCGGVILSKNARKFCCVSCYKSHLMAGRFLRKPLGVPLPQCDTHAMEDEIALPKTQAIRFKKKWMLLYSMVIEGFTNDQIAKKLNVSKGEVKLQVNIVREVLWACGREFPKRMMGGFDDAMDHIEKRI